MGDATPPRQDGEEIEQINWPRIPVAWLTAIYVVVAGLWVVLSDLALLGGTPPPGNLAIFSSVKGLAFVGVTGGLLYGLLARARRVQQRIEASLRSNEARYKQLTEHAPDIIYHYRLRPEPGFAYVSSAVTRIIGYTPADHYADPQLGMKLVYPDDRPLLAAAMEQVEAGRPLLLRWVHRDGRLIWTEQHNVPIRDEAGQMVGVEGVARDVSERERSAAQLRLLEVALGATANAVVIVNTSGIIQWTNEAFRELTGYAPDEAMGQSARLLRSGLHTQSFYQNLWDTVLRGDVWRGELVNRRKDGTLYHEEQTITPVYGHDSSITHFIAIKQDVTERVLRDREQHSLATLAATLRKTSSRAELTPAILSEVPVLVQAEGAAIVLREATTGETVFEAGTGIWAAVAGARLPQGEGITGRVIATGTPVVVADGAELDVIASGDSPLAAVCLPLRAHDEVIGALWLHCLQAPEVADLRLLEAIAGMAGSAIHRAALHEQTAQRLRRLTSLHTIDKAITASHGIGPTLETVLEQVTAQLGVDAAAVLLLDERTGELSYAAGQGFRTHAAEARLHPGEALLGEAVFARRPIHLPTIPATDDRFTRGALLAAEGFVAYYAMPLIARGQVKGALEIFHRAQLAPNAEWLHFLEAVAAQTAIAIDNAELLETLQRANDELAGAYDSTLEGWARALELRDRETEGHSRRVTALTELLAQALAVPDEQLVHIRRGALLHDIGKMGVPDAILHKPGKLDPEEWAQMQEHPAHAQRLLSPIAYLRPALEIPYCHHERWDGSGYPRGLAGEAIPLAARIFAVVDVWDALTTARPYKDAWPPEQARAYLEAHAGKLFDPAVVAAFLGLLDTPDNALVARVNEAL